jgi:hypothetical protein
VRWLETQNADDAKATTVRFCLDHRSFGTDRLLDPKLAPFQGPALYAYNDGVFSERDFESISKIGDSVKREQTGKTGRFGWAALRAGAPAWPAGRPAGAQACLPPAAD